MRTFVILLISIFATQVIFSSDRDFEKQELQKMLAEREIKFGDYSRAAAARSGLFGSKSKNDLRNQLDVLTEIVRSDNKIIRSLESYLDYRTFQKTEMNYSQVDLDEKNKRLSDLTTNLSAKVTSIEKEKKSMLIKLKWSEFLNYVLFVIACVALFKWWRLSRIRKIDIQTAE